MSITSICGAGLALSDGIDEILYDDFVFRMIANQVFGIDVHQLSVGNIFIAV